MTAFRKHNGVLTAISPFLVPLPFGIYQLFIPSWRNFIFLPLFEAVPDLSKSHYNISQLISDNGVVPPFWLDKSFIMLRPINWLHRSALLTGTFILLVQVIKHILWLLPVGISIVAFEFL